MTELSSRFFWKCLNKMVNLAAKSLQLISIMADGRFYSGAALGEKLGITRGAVWKLLKPLQTLDLEIHAVRGKGYQLSVALELLDGQYILDNLSSASRANVSKVDVLSLVDSTNEYLKRQSPKKSGQLCLAEFQSHGKGRRGRNWVSPFGANLYLSMTWRFNKGIAAINGLSAAVALCLLDALEQAGFKQIALKWPNDLFWDKRKLGGVLIEISGEVADSCCVIIGIGINVRMPAAAWNNIDQPAVDLATLVRGDNISRNQLAVRIINQLVKGLILFDQQGFTPFYPLWLSRDILRDQPVVVENAGVLIQGIARGIDQNGALLIDTTQGRHKVLSGDVSIRPVSHDTVC